MKGKIQCNNIAKHSQNQQNILERYSSSTQKLQKYIFLQN